MDKSFVGFTERDRELDRLVRAVNRNQFNKGKNMGHANFTNISKIFEKLLNKNGQISLRQVVTELKARKEKVHASEGDYGEEEDYMLSYACEQILQFLLEAHGKSARTLRRKWAPILEPVNPTSRQEELINQFLEGNNNDWDCGDDGNGGDYGEFDHILWKRTEAWKTGKIPLLGEFTN